MVSIDTLVEGEDFRLAWSSGHHLGVKVAAQNLADVAAMGAYPLALLVSLAAPGDLPVELIEGLTAGLAAECRRAGATVVGGDVSAAAQVVITGTALGLLTRGTAPVRRSGARPGDVVALAGRTGASAAGLAVLSAGLATGAATGSGPSALDGVGEIDPGMTAAVEAVLSAHRMPQPPYPAGPAAAAAGATALIDTSDGLLRDAVRIATASAVVIDLELDALPRSVHLQRVAALLTPGREQAGPGEAGPGKAGSATNGTPADELVEQWLLTGGEDHALLACLPPGSLPAGFVAIGKVAEATQGESPGVRLDGRPVSGRLGWKHW